MQYDDGHSHGCTSFCLSWSWNTFCGSSLWASILSVPAPPPPQRTCLCALWALTALFLAFQSNELWILNDFMPSSLAALPQGVSAEIFNSFACQRLVTVYIWSVLKACGFLPLNTAEEKKKFELNRNYTEAGFYVGLIYGKNLAEGLELWQWTCWHWHLNSGKGRKEDDVNSLGPKPVFQEHLMNPEAIIYSSWKVRAW